MTLTKILEQKLEELDQKVKARLAYHEMDPELKRMWDIRQNFKKIGQNIDEQIELIERMKAKLDKLEGK